MERATIASHVFALICTSLLIGFAAHNALNAEHMAEHMLEVGAVTEARVLAARVTGGRKHCRYHLKYSFRTDDGQTVFGEAGPRCRKNSWLPWAAPEPVPDALSVVYMKNDPARFRLMWELEQDLKITSPFVAILAFLVFWAGLYTLARRTIAWMVKLP